MAALRHFGDAVAPKLNFPGSVAKFEAQTGAPPEAVGQAPAAGPAAAVATPAAAAAVPPQPAVAAAGGGTASFRGVSLIDGRWKAIVQHKRNQVGMRPARLALNVF